MVFRDNHLVEDLNRVAPKLVVMAETEIDDAADKRIEIRLIPLNADVGLEREKLKRYFAHKNLGSV
jgi:hypothetical protein